MRRVRSWLLTPFLVLVLSSCGTCRWFQAPNQPTLSDSLRVEIKEREVIIRDTILFALPREVEQITLRQDSSLLQNSYARSKAAILPSGELYHSLETLPQQLSKPIEQRAKVRDSIIYRERMVTQIVERDRELSTWQRVCINGFYLLFSLFLLLLLFLLRFGRLL